MTKRTPIGIHKITIATVMPTSTGIGIYDRTVYTRLDGSYEVSFRGIWLPVSENGYDNPRSMKLTFVGTYVHAEHIKKTRINGQKQVKSLV